MRVLVVEDEPELISILSKGLREDGYAVDEAGDGQEGLYKAVTWEYDAIILDLMLPKLDGWNVLTQLRHKRKTPVLILTARDAINDRIRGLDVGADDYLVKPFDFQELRARLRALIRRGLGQASPLLAIQGIEIDTRSRKVSCNGAEVVLTAREYSILELLALRQGQVISRTEIYEHIFDEKDDTISNLLDVHISNIRKKLGKNLITTRRGQGYVIDG